MDWNRNQIKQRLLVVCGGVAFFCALQNLPAVALALRWVLVNLGISAAVLLAVNLLERKEGRSWP